MGFDVRLAALMTITFALAYLVGAIPSAYLIVRFATGSDITEHGSGNVGAMNVRRSTGSWAWFVAAMFADALKGALPVAVAKSLATGSVLLFATPTSSLLLVQGMRSAVLVTMSALAGAVVGHNYSVWMALIKHQFKRTGKGLATGGGALLSYDWRYFVAVVLVGIVVIALSRYMMAGQVAAALTLPISALLLRSPDWPFALVMGLFVYAAHHRRFVGLLKGEEPRLYVDDRMGPRG
ncbi:MAG: hypothetical protein CVT67_07260 [Actinobacteria bacterium HGW-Actinobacteria-7]|jgi:glycerol-3-phosphate acyltransferase PlsY|nr:MAG: hypothetical protein CVT67_07260 [Actinobacteria bacterium HGW-Actinobacteria-7]